MKTFFTSVLIYFTMTIAWLIPNVVQGQNIVERQILQIGVLLALDGYNLTHDIKYENLRDGQYDNYYFTLDKGWSYKIVAVCDGDCGDIDLCLFDENGNKIDCDETDDDKPIVSVSPKWTGRFRLWVKMYDCKVNPCKFGIGVLGK